MVRVRLGKLRLVFVEPGVSEGGCGDTSDQLLPTQRRAFLKADCTGLFIRLLTGPGIRQTAARVEVHSAGWRNVARTDAASGR